MNVIRCALLLACIGVGASAQTALLDNFKNAGATGAVISSSSWAIGTNVVRNTETITVGGTARDDSGWEAKNQNINGASMTHITVLARRDAGNLATSLVVQLIDSNLGTHTVSIPTDSFQESAFTKVDIPIGTWTAGFLPAQIKGWNIGGGRPPMGTFAFRMTFDELSLTGGVAPTAPTITVEPLDRAIGIGTGTTMTVTANANNSGNLRYQWKKAGTDITGATLATLSFSDAQPVDSGLYQVVVSNDAPGFTLSREARLTVFDARPTHALAPGNTGYLAGSPLTISNTIVYTGSPTQLRWSAFIPISSGWSFASDNATTATRIVGTGQDADRIEWTWSSVPASPFTFTYTLNVPVGAGGDAQIRAFVEFTQNAVVGQIMAKPDPLKVYNALSRHSADSDGDFFITLFELTRVIELYNTRNGTVRTGAYAVATVVTEDGFAPDPNRPDQPATNFTHYHSGDSTRDGRINLFELTRVIELYNTRQGTVRTGQYHVDPSNPEDGFAAGP